jgi:uncharacterized membrane protein YfcA
MNWTVYWFMLPVCITVASVAMFSGISGAALLTPIFLIGFPLFGVPRLTTVAAIGTSLFLETSGFGTGLYRYLSMRLVDIKTAKSIILFTLPLGALGAIVARHVPAEALRIGYGIAMLVLAWLLLRDEPGGKPVRDIPAPAIVSQSDQSHLPCGPGEERNILAVNGKLYSYCAHGLALQRVLSGGGAFLAGLISTGVGEATLPGLVQRSRFPVPIAAATSTVIVAGTVVGAAATHLVQLDIAGGLSAIPWDLIVWAVPGAIIGAFIGTRLQGRVSERVSRRFFSGLFAAIGIAFLLAFTVFVARFG